MVVLGLGAVRRRLSEAQKRLPELVAVTVAMQEELRAIFTPPAPVATGMQPPVACQSIAPPPL